ncbi:hypothetical protein SLE2022_383330 [Rubroshorea leprosula]
MSTRHTHSPKTPTTMLDRALSARRPASHSDSDFPTDASSADPESNSGAADESKTKRPNLALLITKYLSRLGHPQLCIPCPFLVPLLCLLVSFILLFSLTLKSRSLVCVSSYDPISRAGFFGFDGLDLDFGALGVPWCRSKQGKTVEWTSKDLIKGLEEFVPIYETRPIKNNMYGMGFDHSFGLWFITRWLQPDLMIESGAFKGHSTWVLRQAMPDKPIISKVLKRHGISDPTRVLVFFDDHQSELKRVKQAVKAGFHHLVFEDNYDTGTGDHYSLRQICDQFYIRGGGHSCFRDGDEARIRSKRKKFWAKAVDVDELCGPNEAWWGVRGEMLDDFNKNHTPISYADHFANSRFIESVLDLYWELPPVAGPSLTHQTRYDPARTPIPIVEDGRYGLFQRLGLGRLETSVFNGYTQMVYIQISQPGKSVS